MHRIVSISADGVVTKGDANPVPDPWGRVKPRTRTVEHLVAVIPDLGRLINIRRQLLSIAGGVLLLALATALWSRGRRSRVPDAASRADDSDTGDGHDRAATPLQLANTQPNREGNQ